MASPDDMQVVVVVPEDAADDPTFDLASVASDAAIEAVGQMWLQILREKHPGVSWEVTHPRLKP